MATMEWQTEEGRCRLTCWAAAVAVGLVAYLLFDAVRLGLLAPLLGLVALGLAGLVLTQAICAARAAGATADAQSPDAVFVPQAAPAPGPGGAQRLARAGGGAMASMPPPDAATAEWDEAQESGSTAATSAVAYEAPAELAAPALLDAPRGGQADDLQAIGGIGPRVSEALNDLGVWHLDQIAAWTPANLAWVEAQVPTLRGRAERDDWVGQAKALSARDE